MSVATESSRMRLSGWICCVVAAVLVPLGTAQPSAAQTTQGESGGPVTLVVALGSSLSDVGTAASLVAAGEGRAVVFASSPSGLGDAAVGVVAETQPARVLIVGGTAAVGASIQAELSRTVPGVSIERLAGTDRVHTAALAAQRALAGTDGASVIIANGWSLPDVGAAAAAVAAGAADAVLYAQSDRLGEPTREALDRHRPARVLIAGGTAALSAQVQQQAAQAAGGATTSRLGGATRTKTAALLAQTALESGADTAVIANGWSLPDVGAAAALAASLDGSYVVYAQSADSLGEPASAALVGHPPARAYLIGDTDTLTTAVHEQLRQAVPNADVIAVTDPAHTTHHALGITPPTTPMADVVEYRAGDTIPGFPSGFAAASGNFSSASVSITGGGTTVTVTIGPNGTAAYADTTYTCTTAGGCTIVNGRVTAGTINATTTAATTSDAAPAPDLVVDTPTVSDSSPTAGASFTLSATVRNQGSGPSASTTLRYFRSADATITTADTPAGTDTVSRLDARGTGAESTSVTAPSTPETYYYGACVDSASDESDKTNNCSAAVTVTVGAGEIAPDLVVDTPTVTNSSPIAGASFTLSATVRNQGSGPSASATLRYYRSADATITTGDTEVGTDSVFRLDAQESGAESVSLTAPTTPGTYYYGACVGLSSGESDTTNNCSGSVQVTVSASAGSAVEVSNLDCSGEQLHAGSSLYSYTVTGEAYAHRDVGDVRVGYGVGYFRELSLGFVYYDGPPGAFTHLHSMSAGESKSFEFTWIESTRRTACSVELRWIERR